MCLITRNSLTIFLSKDNLQRFETRQYWFRCQGKQNRLFMDTQQNISICQIDQIILYVYIGRYQNL